MMIIGAVSPSALTGTEAGITKPLRLDWDTAPFKYINDNMLICPCGELILQLEPRMKIRESTIIPLNETRRVPDNFSIQFLKRKVIVLRTFH